MYRVRVLVTGEKYWVYFVKPNDFDATLRHMYPTAESILGNTVAQDANADNSIIDKIGFTDYLDMMQEDADKGITITKDGAFVTGEATVNCMSDDQGTRQYVNGQLVSCTKVVVKPMQAFGMFSVPMNDLTNSGIGPTRGLRGAGAARDLVDTEILDEYVPEEEDKQIQQYNRE
jgi:hypothetical protein